MRDAVGNADRRHADAVRMDPFGDVQEDFRCRDDDVGPVGVQAECGDPLLSRRAKRS